MSEPDWSPIFQYEEPGASGDNIEVAARGDGVTITIEEPWAGSTATGFGYSCSIRLNRAALREFADWIAKASGQLEDGRGQ